jgi:hypothetical protein
VAGRGLQCEDVPRTEGAEVSYVRNLYPASSFTILPWFKAEVRAQPVDGTPLAASLLFG